MKYILRLLFAFSFAFTFASMQADTDYGCSGSHILKIGERVTLKRTVNTFSWTRVNWVLGYGGKSVKFISQEYDSCTIEAEAECSDVRVYCELYYQGERSFEYYIIDVEANGLLKITASQPDDAVLLAGEKVYLSTNYPDATINYTLDGSTPTTKSPVYTSDGITVNSNSNNRPFAWCTLKAIAVKNGYADSGIFERTYWIKYTFTEETVEGVEMKYEITDVNAKTCEVTRETIDINTSGQITIPQEVRGYKVTKICERAFEGCKNLTTVVIPNSVTSIGDYAFEGCGLTSIEIPNATTVIGNDAFLFCSNLVSVKISDSVTTIGERAFMYCTKITSINIPNSVVSIGRSAFYGCRNLEHLTLPQSIKRIEEDTFLNCIHLREIIGFNNIDYLGHGNFTGSLWEQNLPDGMNFLGKVLFKYQGEMPANTTVSIPSGCTQIYDNAFVGKDWLVGINIPASVADIAEGAFNNCSNLQNITVDASNTVYDSRNNCNAIIKKATNTLTHGCSGTTIPTNVTSIGASAFYGNWTKDEIVIPNQIDSIANYAFYNCSSVKSILIGKGLRKMGLNVFNQLPHLKEIAVSTSNPYYDSRDNCNAIIEKATNALLVGCSGTTIPNSVKTIGSYAYYGNGDENFTSLVIPNSVEEIKSYAFDELPYLREVSIGANVKTFGNYMFYKCNNLEAIESLNGFPDDIDEKVFDSGNKDFSIYDNVTLYVPVGCRNNYRLATGWSNFKNIVEGSMGIDDVLAPQPKDDAIYSPTGVRLSVPQRGVNIVNGKKLLVK